MGSKVTKLHGSNCPDIKLTKVTYFPDFTEKQKQLIKATGRESRFFNYLYETSCGTYFTWGAEVGTSLKGWNEVWKVEKSYLYITFKGV